MNLLTNKRKKTNERNPFASELFQFTQKLQYMLSYHLYIELFKWIFAVTHSTGVFYQLNEHEWSYSKLIYIKLHEISSNKVLM
jgi:hypothetical protein